MTPTEDSPTPEAERRTCSTCGYERHPNGGDRLLWHDPEADPDEWHGLMHTFVEPASPAPTGPSLDELADRALERMDNDTRTEEEKIEATASWIANSTLGDSPTPPTPCPNCAEPALLSGGQWWHLSSAPTDCANPPEDESPEPLRERVRAMFDEAGMGPVGPGYKPRWTDDGRYSRFVDALVEFIKDREAAAVKYGFDSGRDFERTRLLYEERKASGVQ